MDKQKVSGMIDKFLVGMLASELAEDEEAAPAAPPVVEGHAEPAGGWGNPYDSYMYPIANRITEEFGLEKEGATDLVLALAEKLAEAKNLPAPPKAGVDVPEADMQKWVAAAKAIKFEDFCMKVADRVMQEAVEETKGETDGE